MAALGWSSLPADLVHRVADCLLATNDLDCYTDLRAVCHHWRSVTADPGSNQHDPRFRPSRWVMLDEHKVGSSTITAADDNDGALLFVNTATGRFLRRSLLLLRDPGHAFVTSTPDGLLVLAASDPPHAVSVLNPFTGLLVRFAASLPTSKSKPTSRLTASVSVVVGSSPPTLVLVSVASDEVYWADPQSESFTVDKSHLYCPASRLPQIAAAAGKCAADFNRASFSDDKKTILSLLHSIDLADGGRCYVVVNAGGDMLAVLKRHLAVDVFKIDAAGNVIERVESIGTQALFLGVRCLVVDTDCFPTVEPNCAYFRLPSRFRQRQFYILKFCIGTDADDEEGPEVVSGPDMDTMRPLTLTQLLCSYTMEVPGHPLTWGKCNSYLMSDSYHDYIDYIHDESDDDDDDYCPILEEYEYL